MSEPENTYPICFSFFSDDDQEDKKFIKDYCDKCPCLKECKSETISRELEEQAND